jgi:hypothetical protein
MVLFRNVFDGELPAVEYPKINVSLHQLVHTYYTEAPNPADPRQFYMALSITYFLIGCLWAFLCVRHFRELL